MTQHNFRAAKATLDTFHLVVVTELLHLPEYRRWILDLFQIDENRLPIYLWQNLRNIKSADYSKLGNVTATGHIRSTGSSVSKMAASPRARKRMDGYPSTAPQDFRRKLEAVNRGDILLHRYALKALLGTDELATSDAGDEQDLPRES